LRPTYAYSGREKGKRDSGFGLLDAPAHDKRHVLVEGGTAPSDWREVSKLVLAWLDNHLGVVR